ncbi:MAG: sugar phosphate isomerase/epimerase [Proteobacteria bacterium]|nr:sugar phosphate isomerase/epimerase [Pseudomonadota bacterium]
MKIGMITDSLGKLSFEALLTTSARLGLDALEFACGNWSSAPHINLAKMLESEKARREFKAAVADHGLEISALNCSGNPLHPGESGRQHDRVTRDTIKLASLMGIDRVVMMSGCPGAPGDKHPNWITVEWPAELREILRWQWDDVLIPYWRDLVAYANNLGIRKLCLELHGFQNVYSVRTLARLRNAVGDTVGANFDPSHLMWMGADPLVAVRALGSAIYHVHAKDTRIDPNIATENGILETVPGDRFQERAWNYITLGYGHGEQWWSEFCAELAIAGYDDVLSIEHEDPMMPALEGVEKSVALLDRASFNRPRRARAN